MNTPETDKSGIAKYWSFIIETGIQPGDSEKTALRYKNLNKIAVYEFLIGFFSIGLVTFFLNENHITVRTILFTLVGPLVLLLSYFRLLQIGRVVICFLPSFIYFIMPILLGNIILGNFFWFPSGLLFASFVPILVYNIRTEKVWIITIMAVLGICAFFIDKWMLLGLREAVDLTIIYDNYYFYKVPQFVLWISISLMLFRQVDISNKLVEEGRDVTSLLEKKNRQIHDQSEEIKKQFNELSATQKQLVSDKDELNKLNAKISANEEVLKKAYLKLRENREEIESQNNLIISQNKELLVKQKEISDLNINLEKLVEERTNELENKNKALLEYAHFNSHQVRAPLARIMGILYLLKIQDLNKEADLEDLVGKLDDSVNELDLVVRKINDLFEKENKSVG